MLRVGNFSQLHIEKGRREIEGEGNRFCNSSFSIIHKTKFNAKTPFSFQSFLTCFLLGNKHEKCSPLISADPPEKVTKSNCPTSLIQ